LWYLFLLTSAGGYMIGSWFFTAWLDRLLFCNMDNNKREHSSSRIDKPAQKHVN